MMQWRKGIQSPLGEILYNDNEWKNDIFIFGCDVNAQNHRILRGQWNYSSYNLTQNAVTKLSI